MRKITALQILVKKKKTMEMEKKIYVMGIRKFSMTSTYLHLIKAISRITTDFCDAFLS